MLRHVYDFLGRNETYRRGQINYRTLKTNELWQEETTNCGSGSTFKFVAEVI